METRVIQLELSQDAMDQLMYGLDHRMNVLGKRKMEAQREDKHVYNELIDIVVRLKCRIMRAWEEADA